MEMIVAMAILTLAVLPIGYSFLKDARLVRLDYQRAVLMEWVDGEMEILAAGEGRDLPEGTHPYTAAPSTASPLPPGQCLVTRTGKHLRLEWIPSQPAGIGSIVREASLP